MSKVASITISAKSRTRSGSYDTSPTISNAPKNGVFDDVNSSEKSPGKTAGLTSSDSEEDRHFRRRGSSSSNSPERKRQASSRGYDTYDHERGLIHAGRSGKMSSRQRTLEQELNTEDPSFVTSSDDALASSDDGLEDNFIPRKQSGQYYEVRASSESEREDGGNIYQKKNIEPPRVKSEPAGNRVKSATGKLLDNYVRDQSFDNLSEGEREVEKPKTSVSLLKAAYSKQTFETKPLERYKVDEELEQIKYTMQARGMMENNDSDDGGEKQETEREVLYRKPLSSIKDRFLAAASGRRVRSSSDSEDEVEEEGKKEEVVPASLPVTDIKVQWQKRGNWEDTNKVARDDVVTSAQSVSEMKSDWQRPRVWVYEGAKDDIDVSPQTVLTMKYHWQQPRDSHVEENKERAVLSEKGVAQMKQIWSRTDSIVDEMDENKVARDDIVTSAQSVSEMKSDWQRPRVWVYEGAKDDIDVSPQTVLTMKYHWQQPRDSHVEENKERAVLSEKGVAQMKQIWSRTDSIVDEMDENKENREEIVAPLKHVSEMTISWQEGEPWTNNKENLLDAEEVFEDINARDEIDATQVGSARNAFRQLENRRDDSSFVNKPRVNKIADPKQIMEARRQKTYGDGSEIDGVVRREGQDELSAVDFDVSQIQAAKHTFKSLTITNDDGTKATRRPSMKLIKQEDVGKTMDAHRRKVTAEDFDDYAEHTKPNGAHDPVQYVNGEPVPQPEA